MTAAPSFLTFYWCLESLDMEVLASATGRSKTGLTLWKRYSVVAQRDRRGWLEQRLLWRSAELCVRLSCGFFTSNEGPFSTVAISSTHSQQLPSAFRAYDALCVLDTSALNTLGIFTQGINATHHSKALCNP